MVFFFSVRESWFNMTRREGAPKNWSASEGAAKISSFEFQYLHPLLAILNELSLTQIQLHLPNKHVAFSVSFPYGSFATIKKVCLPVYLFVSIDVPHWTHINWQATLIYTRKKKWKRGNSFFCHKTCIEMTSSCLGMSACLFYYRQSQILIKLFQPVFFPIPILVLCVLKI